MNNFDWQIESALAAFKENFSYVLIFVGLLWSIHIINWLLGYRLNILGIYPRSLHGLIGIIFSPFLHGHFDHLFFNTIPLLILTNFVMLNGLKEFFCVSLTIILLSGFSIWLIGRKAIHIGASALIMGYWSFTIVSAYYQQTAIAILAAVITLYYFGGMILNLFPIEIKSSWEGHLSGFVAGIVAAKFCPYYLGLMS